MLSEVSLRGREVSNEPLAAHPRFNLLQRILVDKSGPSHLAADFDLFIRRKFELPPLHVPAPRRRGLDQARTGPSQVTFMFRPCAIAGPVTSDLLVGGSPRQELPLEERRKNMREVRHEVQERRQNFSDKVRWRRKEETRRRAQEALEHEWKHRLRREQLQRAREHRERTLQAARSLQATLRRLFSIRARGDLREQQAAAVTLVGVLLRLSVQPYQRVRAASKCLCARVRAAVLQRRALEVRAAVTRLRAVVAAGACSRRYSGLQGAVRLLRGAVRRKRAEERWRAEQRRRRAEGAEAAKRAGAAAGELQARLRRVMQQQAFSREQEEVERREAGERTAQQLGRGLLPLLQRRVAMLAFARLREEEDVVRYRRKLAARRLLAAALRRPRHLEYRRAVAARRRGVLVLAAVLCRQRCRAEYVCVCLREREREQKLEQERGRVWTARRVLGAAAQRRLCRARYGAALRRLSRLPSGPDADR